MIIEAGFIGLTGPWGILALMAMAVAMLVNRAGASMVFFDVVGRFQAERLIKDADTSMTVFNAVMLDSFANIQDSLNVIGTSFEGLVNSVMPMTEAVADAEIELSKFLVASEDLDAVTSSVVAMGEGFGYTGDQALSAAAKMAQLASVLGTGQTETGTQLGMEFGLISGMETEAAMQRLINLNQQLYFMTQGTNDLMTAEEKGNKIRENTISVMDRLNTIENRSASTMEQITFVMNQFASQAHLTGESIEMMAAQSAVLIETGEEQGKAGRALKQIYARLGADTNGARKEFERLNIAVEDSNGNLRPLSELLGDLNQKWSGLEAAERQAIAQSVAGNRHYTRFIKLMNNYDRSVQLATEANEGLFPAMEEVEKRLDADITKFRAAEAALSNYRAELGDALLPALTATTEKQAEFTRLMSNLVGLFGDTMLGGAILQVGLGIKSLAVPLMGVVTNIAAMTVAMQTNRAVTRAMAGEQLMLEEAFGQGMMLQIQNLNTIKERNQLGAAVVEVLKSEFVALQILNEEQKEQLRINILNEQITQSRMKSEMGQLQMQIRQAALKKSIAEEERMNLVEGETAYKNQTTVVDGHIQKIAQLQIELEELQMRYDETTAAVNRHAQAYGGSLAAERREENTMIKKENDLRAAQAQQLYAVGGAFLGLGSALTLVSDNQDVVRVGMAMQIAGTVTLTAKQMALLGTTLLKSAAEMRGIAIQKQTTYELWLQIIGLNSNTTATKINTAETAKNTAAKSAQALATGAASSAAIGGAAGSGAAAGSAAGPWGALAGAIVTTVIALGAFYLTSKKAKTEVESITGSVDRGTLDLEVFTDTVLNNSLSLDMLAESANQAKLATDALRDSTLEASDAEISARSSTEKTTREAYLSRVSASAAARDDIEGDVGAIIDALDIIDNYQPRIRRGILWDEYNILTGENMTQAAEDAFVAATALEAQETHLVALIKSMSNLTEEEIVAAILANGRYVNQLENDTNDAIRAIGAVMEASTGTLAEFNNAREELFYGMAASNISGDLVKQVVNRGVEHLLVNTEVIMTNNFNGMTTEQAAQEILDHVERGARMRGVDMSTVSQSI